MANVAVVYWSQTGNTAEMAKFVAQGARGKGASVDVYDCDSDTFDTDTAAKYDAVAFGCPAMGDEELEDTVFEPMFAGVENSLGGKKVALFGSYGWGDGDWMRSWEDRCKNDGIDLFAESVMANEAPDSEAEAACKALGEALA